MLTLLFGGVADEQRKTSESDPCKCGYLLGTCPSHDRQKKSLRKLLVRWWKNRQHAATIDFFFVFPVFRTFSRSKVSRCRGLTTGILVILIISDRMRPAWLIFLPLINQQWELSGSELAMGHATSFLAKFPFSPLYVWGMNENI